MFSYQYSHDVRDVQAALDENFPSPESDLIALSSLAAHSPTDYKFARFRFIVLEIDGLMVQLRWHIGQVMALINQSPNVIEHKYAKHEVPIRGHLLLRKEIVQPEWLLFAGLTDTWRGGNVAEWIFQMTMDNTIVRAISLLDKLTRLLVLVAEVASEDESIYFRGQHLSLLHEKLQLVETQNLLKLSQDPLLALLFDFRDNWNFERLTHSNIAGFLPVDTYLDVQGQRQKLSAQQVSGDLLLALINAAYAKIVQVLHETVAICDKNIPVSQKNLAW